jgi:phage baseplate assembly protein V
MKAALDRLRSSIRNAVTRGKIISSALSSNQKYTLVQVSGLAGDVRQKLRLFLPYGMSALPKGGEDVVRVTVNGSHTHMLVLFADAGALRIVDLQNGEFGWRDYNGQQIVFRNDRIEVTTPLKLVANVSGDLDATVGGDVNLTVTGKVTGSASEWDLTGNLKVTGNISATGDVKDSVRTMAADRALYNEHDHAGTDSHGDSFTTLTPNPTQ